MSDHLPECPCNHADERGCFLISAETDRCVDCICDRLRACEQRVREEESRNVIGSVSLAAIGEANLQQYQLGFSEGLDAAREAVLAYADDTHQHVGMLKCWPENGDRCDITAALRVAAQRIDDLREEKK